MGVFRKSQKVLAFKGVHERGSFEKYVSLDQVSTVSSDSCWELGSQDDHAGEKEDKHNEKDKITYSKT